MKSAKWEPSKKEAQDRFDCRPAVGLVELRFYAILLMMFGLSLKNQKTQRLQKWKTATALSVLACLAGICHGQVDPFEVTVYRASDPPPTPVLEELPLVTQVSQHGITWTFSEPERVGRFVNGDYYVVGEATITDIDPRPTTSNGRHGSMLNIPQGRSRSGFDSRIQSGRYEASLRVYPPIRLTPGNQLVSSRSAGTDWLPAVMRPINQSDSPVASISILTSLAAPQPPDTFRPSYAEGSTKLYRSRNLNRELLPKLPPVSNVPPLSEFEGYLQRPWVDSVFFSFAIPSEYMASYGREIAYIMSFSGLLLTLDFSDEEKEPLLVYLTQYGIDLFGLVEQGHAGWRAHGGHGSGRKFPIVLAGMLLGEDAMKSVQARFGEDEQTIWPSESPGNPAGSWHSQPASVLFGGHAGIHGESVEAGWGPYEHLDPSDWLVTLGERYRRCCTSASWVGEALAARLIPGMQAAWNHPQFFAYVDRWMFVPDAPQDLERLRQANGMVINEDLMQGQAWKILSGGGYHTPHRRFVDEMWAAYRQQARLSAVERRAEGGVKFTVKGLLPGRTHLVQRAANLHSPDWVTLSTNVVDSSEFPFIDPAAPDTGQWFYRVITLPELPDS